METAEASEQPSHPPVLTSPLPVVSVTPALMRRVQTTSRTSKACAAAANRLVDRNATVVNDRGSRMVSSLNAIPLVDRSRQFVVCAAVFDTIIARRCALAVAYRATSNEAAIDFARRLRRGILARNESNDQW